MPTPRILGLQVNGTGRIIPSDVVSGRRCYESDEYERFANSRTSRDSSTPKREEKRKWRQAEKRAEDRPRREEEGSGNARYKHLSTVSLPNYDELDTTRHRSRQANQQDESTFEVSPRPRRPVRSSTVSLPAESFLSPFSEVRNDFPTNFPLSLPFFLSDRFFDKRRDSARQRTLKEFKRIYYPRIRKKIGRRAKSNNYDLP